MLLAMQVVVAVVVVVGVSQCGRSVWLEWGLRRNLDVLRLLIS